MPRFIVFVDIETTGVDSNQDAIVQISALKFCGNQEVDRLNTYINPGRPIPSNATAIHKITDDMVKDAPRIDDIRGIFLEFVKDSILVGYNVTFDLRFISIAFGEMFNEVRYLDVMYFARRHLDLPDYRLETVAAHLGFSPDSRFHDSMADCEATADVFWKLIIQTLSIESPTFYAPKQKKKKLFDRFCPKEIIPQATPADENHPLYGKIIVFTGELSISRREAAQAAVNVGANIKSSISSKTSYLVVGRQDPTIVGPDGMSGKEEKAHELNALGKASIEIISEREFMLLLGEVVQCG